MEHLPELTTLGLGGVFAALAVGWGHLKSIWSYISGFAFATAHLDGPAALKVHRYLHSTCWILPNGTMYYTNICMEHTKLKKWRDVPFRLPMANAIFFYRGVPLLVSFDENPTIRTIRGLVDLDQLIAEAYRRWDVEYDDVVSNRYYIQDVQGQDKFGNSTGLRSSSNDVAYEQPHGSPNLPKGLWREVLVGIHSSLLYSDDDIITVSGGADALVGYYFEANALAYLESAKRWMAMRDWYIERGIPWRKGVLAHGRGGTGKSSLSRIIAKELGIPIYRFFLSTLSDSEFVHEWKQMNKPCIALLEDLDSVFDGRESTTEHKALSFDVVLNTISGVSDSSGVLLYVTTNRLEKIDPAMGVVESNSEDGLSTRPGRIDEVIEINGMSEENRHRLASHILRDWPDLIESVITKVIHLDVTPAQLQELCIQAAFKRLKQEEKKEHGSQYDLPVPEKSDSKRACRAG